MSPRHLRPLSSDLVTGVRLSVGTLTVVPVGALMHPSRRAATVAMTVAPLAAVPLGGLVLVVAGCGVVVGLPAPVVAVLVVTSIALGTRAMHLDGLADTVDGLGAGWDRERALAVMKQGDVGPMGAAALVLLLLLQTAALTFVLARPFGYVLAAVALAVSRGACALACLRDIPSARSTGLGAAVAGSVPPPAAFVVGIGSAIALAVGATAAGLPWWLGVAAVVVAAATVGLVVRTAVRVFGGVTGDVMGAAIEIAWTTMLVVLCAGTAS